MARSTTDLGDIEQTPVIAHAELDQIIVANAGANTQFDVKTLEVILEQVKGGTIFFVRGRQTQGEGGTGQGEETKLVAQRKTVFGFYRKVERMEILFDAFRLVREPGINQTGFDTQVLHLLDRHFAENTGVDTVVGIGNRHAPGFLRQGSLAKAGGSTPTDLGKTVCGKHRSKNNGCKGNNLFHNV